MIRRTTRIVIEIIAAMVGVFLLTAGFAAWRLTSGPIPLDFLTPYVTQALSSDSVRIEFHNTVLAWQGWRRAVEVEVRDVHVRGADGAVLASAPELAVRFSLRALASGRIEPTALDLQGAKVAVQRDADGNLIFGIGEGQGAAGGQLPNLMSGILGPPDPDKRFGYLRRIQISEAIVTVQDAGSNKSWNAEITEAAVTRTRSSGLDFSLILALVAEGKTARFTLEGTEDQAAGMLPVVLKFNDVDFVALGTAVPELAALRDVAVPLRGHVNFSLDREWTVHDAAFEINGGQGKIAMAGMEGGGIAIKSLGARGSASDGLTRLTIADLNVQLDGPTVSASAIVNDPLGVGAFDLKASIRDVAFGKLKHYWPPRVAEGGRKWMLANMTEGVGQEVQLAASGQLNPADGKGTSVGSVNGTIKADGLSVRYMPEMPIVRGIAATATFNLGGMDITTTGGAVDGLALTVPEGVIKLSGFDKKVQYGDIRIKVIGPVGDALKLIDNPPLKYASKMNIDPAQVSGESSTKLVINLPLIDDLPVDKLKISADATLKDVHWQNLIMEKTLSNADLRLRVSETEMDAAGAGQLGGVPVKFHWRENFTATSGDTSIIEFAGALDDKARKEFGLDLGPDISGPLAIDATVHFQRAGNPRVNATIDFTAMKIDLDDLGWKKAPGQPTKVVVAGLMGADHRLSDVAFDASGSGLTARGQLRMAGGKFQRVDFERLVAGRNDLQGFAEVKDGGYVVRAKGAAIDVSGMFSADDDTPPPTERKPKAERPKPVPLNIKITADRIWLGEKRWFDTVSATLLREPEGWRTVEVEAKVGPNLKHFGINYGQKKSYRDLTVYSDDAGETLRMLGVLDSAIGGTLQVTGAEGSVEAPLKGEILVENFQVQNAPVLARILSAASLTGILQSMTGKGLQFDKLRADYSMQDELIELRDGRARSADLGLTVEGKVDLLLETLDLKGLIVPAYTINSLLANIPILGQLFGGPGGGLFAATYTVRGPLNDPGVGVNPLSVLAPGFLRYIFAIFDGPGGVSDAPVTPPPDLDVR
ncbi:MAG: AsmA-like C-terminal region-containing protein [Alphaproteobacteria bacterium]